MARPSMTTKRKALTAEMIERFREAIAYDPATGLLTWKVPPAYSASFIGDQIGWEDAGRRRVRIAGQAILCHRVAWAIHFGVDADGFIDHKNGNALDNRIENLRVVTKAQNAKNKAAYKRTHDLPKGVTHHPGGRYRARIRVDGRLICLGVHSNAGAASAAYQTAAKVYFGEFAREAGHAL